jgi:hypothetical protein
LVFKPSDIKKDDSNYCLVNRRDKTAILFLNKYKTSGSYKAQVLNLSKETTKLILKLHPNNNDKELFPDVSKLGIFIMNTFSEVPAFETEKIDIRYLRHSIISTAISKIKTNDPEYALKLEDLANRSFHKVGTQSTYISPLKNINSKLIKNNQAVIDDFNDILNEDG